MLGFILSCLCRPSSLHSEGFKGRRSLPYTIVYSCSKNWRSSPVPLLHAVGLLSIISISFLRRRHCIFRNCNRHPCCHLVVCILYLPYTLEPSIQAVIWLICSRGPKLQPSLFRALDNWKEILTRAPGCWHRPHKLHTFLAKLERNMK